MRFVQSVCKGGGLMETLTQMMSRYTSVAKSTRSKLMMDIDAIPENPNIRRLDICCFTVGYTEVLKSNIGREKPIFIPTKNLKAA